MGKLVKVFSVGTTTSGATRTGWSTTTLLRRRRAKQEVSGRPR